MAGPANLGNLTEVPCSSNVPLKKGPAAEAGEVPLQQPVVPCAGGLFTARDIDSFMDQLGGKKKDHKCPNLCA